MQDNQATLSRLVEIDKWLYFDCISSLFITQIDTNDDLDMRFTVEMLDLTSIFVDLSN